MVVLELLEAESIAEARQGMGGNKGKPHVRLLASHGLDVSRHLNKKHLETSLEFEFDSTGEWNHTSNDGGISTHAKGSTHQVMAMGQDQDQDHEVCEVMAIGSLKVLSTAKEIETCMEVMLRLRV